MVRDLKNAGEAGSVGLGGDRVAVGTGLGDAVESGGSSGAHVGGSGRGKSVARAGLQGGGEAAEDERGNDFGTSSLGAARAPVRGKRRPVMEPAGGSRRTSARLAAQRESTAASAEPVATGGGAVIRGGVLERPRGAELPGVSLGAGGNRVVTGFGPERIGDLAVYQRDRAEGDARRASQRVSDGSRGRAVDLQGNDLDMSAGSAWHLGK